MPLSTEQRTSQSRLIVDKLGGEAWTKLENDTPACGAEPADYSNVYEVLGNIPADLSIYTDESVANLYSAVEALRGYRDLAQQSDVDKMAKDINDAVAALVYKSADYTELDKAEKAAKALNNLLISLAVKPGQSLRTILLPAVQSLLTTAMFMKCWVIFLPTFLSTQMKALQTCTVQLRL